MEIKKYKKLKDNRYQVEIDDLKVNLYDDIIIKYNLLLKKNLTEKEFNEITTVNDHLTAYYKAIKYINTKLRCEKEIIKYLEKLKYSQDIITSTIKELKKSGYINNKLYLSAYINDQINLTSNGPYKIKSNLKSLNFSEEEIDKYLNNININVNERIEKIINKKLKLSSNNSSRKIHDKILYDLINLGYAKENIEEVLSTKTIDDSKSLAKDYLKIKNKLSKKYSDEELNYYVKNKLYAKGYSIDNINKIMQ